MRQILSHGAAVLAITVAMTASGQAIAQSAANKVYGTGITEGKFELGYKGGLDTDSRSQLDMKHKHKLSVGYSSRR